MKKKRALITGGSGFVGSRLASALTKTHEVFLADKNEEQNRLAETITGCAAWSMEISDLSSVRQVVSATRPDLIVHAAASKFVDLAEKDPLGCADVNVIGSQNVARAAMEGNCELVVGLSSNRAAPPTYDTYSLTKAIMERLFCSLNGKTETRFVCTRLGNIAWSTGSVLPVWDQMLERSAVIKTTGPESRRFFLKVDAAVDILMTCIERAEEFQGKVLVRRLKQARVKDVLTAFIEINGGNWELGEARPGEKLDELLIGDLELPYCEELELSGETYYSIGFNEKVEKALGRSVSTANVEPLSPEEIVKLIVERPTSPAVVETTI